MSLSTTAIGVAVCGNCGSELHVVCSGGCADPDIVPRENYVARLPKPRGEEKPPTHGPKYPVPTHCWCGDPVAKRKIGRPPTKCEKHLQPSRAKAAR